MKHAPVDVIPARAGSQSWGIRVDWVPAFAGVTGIHG